MVHCESKVKHTLYNACVGLIHFSYSYRRHCTAMIFPQLMLMCRVGMVFLMSLGEEEEVVHVKQDTKGGHVYCN